MVLCCLYIQLSPIVTQHPKSKLNIRKVTKDGKDLKNVRCIVKILKNFVTYDFVCNFMMLFWCGFFTGLKKR